MAHRSELPYTCIIPAAGTSSRMGAFKLLLRFKAHTIIEEVIAAAQAACSRVAVVTGYRGEEIEELVAGRSGVEAVRNVHYEHGMFTSIQTGLRLVQPGHPAFVALADMPWVRSEDYHKLAETFEMREGCEAARFTHAGAPAHPVLLGPAVVNAVCQSDTNGSMLRILAQFHTCLIPTDDARVARDIDYPEEYEASDSGHE